MEEIKLNDNGITITQLIEETYKFINNKITSEEYEEFGKKITIRTYIPLMEKVEIASKLITKFKYREAYVQEVNMADLYVSMFFNVVINKYCMIDIIDEDKYCTYDNYDLLYPIIMPFAMTYCGNDYKVIKEMITDSMNMYNFYKTETALNNINLDTIKYESEKNRRMLEELEMNEELISNLKDIMFANDDRTKELLEKISSSSRETVMTK